MVRQYDTHILLYALAGDLGAREKKLLSSDGWRISAIVIWEVAQLAQVGRIGLDLDDPELARTFAAIHTWPITLKICRAHRRLDFRSDPRTRSSPPPALSTECPW